MKKQTFVVKISHFSACTKLTKDYTKSLQVVQTSCGWEVFNNNFQKFCK